MTNKLMFLTKMSLNKKIKTKWFLIANLIFAILIVGLINIDSIIKAFGGEFNKTQEILVIDEVGVIDSFKSYYNEGVKYLSDYVLVEINEFSGEYDEATKLVSEEDKILLIVSYDNDNYIKAKVVSNTNLNNVTSTLINTTLNMVRSEVVLDKYNISSSVYYDINKTVELEKIVLEEDNIDDDMMSVTIMQVITMPLFMLIIFLVQMIGAEVNEEKTTKSMEIIISNVSPKTHFLSKVLSSNLFELFINSFDENNSITLYAQWEALPTYTITIEKQSNATVTVDKASTYVGDTITVTMSFSQSNNRG